MKTATEHEEKRRHPRFSIGLAMDIRADGQLAGKCRGTIADLSASGMAFKTNAVLEEGMCLHLKLNFPLEIRGEVRNTAGLAGGMNRYGIRFHKVGYESHEGPGKLGAARFQAVN